MGTSQTKQAVGNKLATDIMKQKKEMTVDQLIEDEDFADDFINPALARRFTVPKCAKAMEESKRKEIMDNLHHKLKGLKSEAPKVHDEALHGDDDLDAGDQFMAVKPWLGAVKPPTIEPLHPDPSPPDVSFTFDFVHGYKSDQVRQNLFYNSTGKPVYMTAALGIILDTQNRTQVIFGGGEEAPMKKGQRAMRKQQVSGQYGHNDDIMALAISDDRKKVVTGSMGREPMVFVWDAETGKRIHFLRLPPGSRSVSALAFNASATVVAAADCSDDYAVHFFPLSDKSTGEVKKTTQGFKADRKMI